MTTYYVHIIGSYDDTFVGPFHDEERTKKYADLISKRGYLTRVLTGTEYTENLRTFGPAHTEEPLL